jgi:hypothetical protein
VPLKFNLEGTGVRAVGRGNQAREKMQCNIASGSSAPNWGVILQISKAKEVAKFPEWNSESPNLRNMENLEKN